MSRPDLRVVIDTNTLLRSLLAGDSAAAKVRRAAESRRVVTLLSKPVLDEYRAVLGAPELCARFPTITPRLVEITVRRLRFVGDFVRDSALKFDYPRDPLDAKFIELALALRATHIITFDKDLLTLPPVEAMPESDFASDYPRSR